MSMRVPHDPPGAGRGPQALLRLEGAVIGGLAILLYARADHSWLWFVLLFLAPDLSMLGYLAGPRIGALVYNAFHAYVAPLVLCTILLLAGSPLMLPLIWIAHIGLDRALGYGLKHATSFQDTHLGRIGRSTQQP